MHMHVMKRFVKNRKISLPTRGAAFKSISGGRFPRARLARGRTAVGWRPLRRSKACFIPRGGWVRSEIPAPASCLRHMLAVWGLPCGVLALDSSQRAAGRDTSASFRGGIDLVTWSHLHIACCPHRPGVHIACCPHRQ